MWNEIIWVLCECHYAWPLPEANATTVYDLTVLSLSSLPLSIMVRSRTFIGMVTKQEFVLARVQIWNPFAQFKFSVYGHKPTDIHTRQVMQSR